MTAVPSVPSVERFTVGVALSRSWGVWLQNLPLFLGIALLAHVPEFILSCLRLGQPPTRLGQRVETLSTSLLAYVVTGLVTYSVLEQLRGRRPSARKSLSVGLARFGPLFGTAIGTGLLTLLLFVALIFPGVYASIRWMLVSPIVVAENAEDPRRRSSFLTEGHRGELFGMLALLWLGLVIVAVLLAVVLPEEDTVVGNAVILLPSALFISFRAVLEGVTYFLLRSEKEGVDLEQLTAVFE